MQKKRIHLFLILIFILVVFAGLLVFSKQYNQGVSFLNAEFNLRIPYFPERPFRLGLDLQGGMHLIYAADLSEIEKEHWPEAMEGLRDVIARRVDLFGVREPVVQVVRVGEEFRLIVELAGVIEPDRAIEMIGETPFLEFKEPRTEEETGKVLAKIAEIEEVIGRGFGEMTVEDFQKIEEIDNWQLAFENPHFKTTPLTGRFLQGATLAFDPTTHEAMVSLEFDQEGAKIFAELTERNINQPLAIYVDRVLISAPVVGEKILGGRAQITGRFTVEEARDLARNLSAGALPVPINLISQQRIGPTLGRVSLQESMTAGLFGFLAIILFMIIFYRLPGVLAILSLSIYVVLALFLFNITGTTITLAGIAGFILSIGMAIDTNILVFSRFREEMKQGTMPRDCLREAFLRAWPSIRDGNLTTLMIAFILFAFGTGFVKGFAFILTLGILVSVFAAMFITRVFMEFFAQTKLGELKFLWR